MCGRRASCDVCMWRRGVHGALGAWRRMCGGVGGMGREVVRGYAWGGAGLRSKELCLWSAIGGCLWLCRCRAPEGDKDASHQGPYGTKGGKAFFVCVGAALQKETRMLVTKAPMGPREGTSLSRPSKGVTSGALPHKPGCDHGQTDRLAMSPTGLSGCESSAGRGSSDMVKSRLHGGGGTISICAHLRGART